MLKARLMGTKNDIKWFGKILGRNPKVEVLEVSDMYQNKGTDRYSIVEDKLPAIEIVRKATMNRIGKFTKQDIRELCPALSVSSVEGSLRKLIELGELKREGKAKQFSAHASSIPHGRALSGRCISKIAIL